MFSNGLRGCQDCHTSKHGGSALDCEVSGSPNWAQRTVKYKEMANGLCKFCINKGRNCLDYLNFAERNLHFSPPVAGCTQCSPVTTDKMLPLTSCKPYVYIMSCHRLLTIHFISTKHLISHYRYIYRVIYQEVEGIVDESQARRLPEIKTAFNICKDATGNNKETVDLSRWVCRGKNGYF